VGSHVPNQLIKLLKVTDAPHKAASEQVQTLDAEPTVSLRVLHSRSGQRNESRVRGFDRWRVNRHGLREVATDRNRASNCSGNRAGATRAGEVDAPGDSFERAADTAAQQVMQGGQPQLAAAGAPPALQRQRKEEKGFSRIEVQQLLTAFLRKQLADFLYSAGQRLTDDVVSRISQRRFRGLERNSEIACVIRHPELHRRSAHGGHAQHREHDEEHKRDDEHCAALVRYEERSHIITR